MKKTVLTVVSICLIAGLLWWGTSVINRTSLFFAVDGTKIDNRYEETIEYCPGMTLADLNAQFLQKLQATRDDEDVSNQIQFVSQKDSLLHLGTYELQYTWKDSDDIVLTYVAHVVDTTAPELDGTKEYSVQTGSSFAVENLNIEVFDNYDMDVLDNVQLSQVDTDREGVQTAVVTVEDCSGNKNTMEIEVDVNDTAAPAQNGKLKFVHKNMDDLTLLLNAEHVLPKGWEPDDLQQISSGTGASQYLRKEAAAAWDDLFEAASKDGIAMYVVSSFRSEDYQESLYNSYLAVDPNAATYSAFPRSSEHELGLAVDISYDYELHEDLQESELGRWMEENSYRYGWVVRYPEGKENITKYIYEPWHYRYVGKELASYLHQNDLTLEEYYSKRLKEG